MSGSSATLEYSPWYRSLNRTQWKTLIASNLGWTFDGFEVFALILTIGAALHQLLDSSEYKYIPFYAGAVIAITVFGWGAAAGGRSSAMPMNSRTIRIRAGGGQSREWDRSRRNGARRPTRLPAARSSR